MEDYVAPLEHEQVKRIFIERAKNLFSSKDEQKLLEAVIGNYVSCLGKLSSDYSCSFWKGLWREGLSLETCVKKTSEYFDISHINARGLFNYLVENNFDFSPKYQSEIIQEIGILKHPEKESKNGWSYWPNILGYEQKINELPDLEKEIMLANSPQSI